MIHTERSSYEWQNASRIERDDGSVSLRFGGCVLFDAGAISQDPNLENATPGCCPAFEVRQARMNVQGVLFHRLLFKVMGELTGGGSLIEAYGGVRELGPVGTLQFASSSSRSLWSRPAA